MEHNNSSAKVCSCNHHQIVPAIIVVVGFVFLLGNLDFLMSDTVGIVWPIAVILIGLMKLSRGNCKCCAK